MEARPVKICCGCLNTGRKMIAIRDIHLLKCFLEIINRNRVSIFGSELLQLCYECTALLFKFTNFKFQVITSYRTFQNYCKQKTEPFTRLKSEKLRNVDITNCPQTNEPIVYLVQDIKTESDTDDVLEDADNAREELSAQEEVLIEQELVKIKKKKKKPPAKLEKETEIEFIEMILNEREIEQERTVLRLRDDYMNAMFTCTNCILTFPNEDDLNEHTDLKHDLNASHFKCAICSCSFGSEVSYNYHVNKHTRRYRCVVCSDMFASKRAASKHYGSTHSHG
ncbi:jg25580, partial [Pararge aegeria aegeria]